MNIFKYIIAILIVGVIILVHEFGHFIVAKASGVFVEEFSVGMGPTLFKHRSRKGTLYSFKLFFLFGGGCRMRTMDEDGNIPEGAFDLAPWGRRFAILIAGPAFNVLLTFVLSVVQFGIDGYLPCKIGQVNENSACYESGLRAGDRITMINGNIIDFQNDFAVFDYMYEGEPLNITYVRDNQTYHTIYQPTSEKVYQLGITYIPDNHDTILSSVVKGTPASRAGLKDGDQILSVNGTKVQDFSIDVSPVVQNCEGKEISFVVRRYQNKDVTQSYEDLTVSFTPEYITRYDFGFIPAYEYVKGTPIEVIGESFKNVGFTFRYVGNSLRMLLTGKASVNDVSGAVGAVSIIGDDVGEAASYGFLSVVTDICFWTILLSSNVGLMNLLPFPALDGGRILFLLIEAVRRKPVPKEKEGIVNMIGFVLLAILLVVVLVNDVRKIIFGW